MTYCIYHDLAIDTLAVEESEKVLRANRHRYEAHRPGYVVLMHGMTRDEAERIAEVSRMDRHRLVLEIDLVTGDQT